MTKNTLLMATLIDRFHTTCIAGTPNNIKIDPKILVWHAVSPVSEAFKGSVRGKVVNADVYIQKCLPKTVEFIQKQHVIYDVIFSPALASCHFAKKTIDYLKSKNIKFVLLAWPIENFWAILRKLVTKMDGKPITRKQFRSRIKKKLKEVDDRSFSKWLNASNLVLDKSRIMNHFQQIDKIFYFFIVHIYIKAYNYLHICYRCYGGLHALNNLRLESKLIRLRKNWNMKIFLFEQTHTN